ncbi:protein kinase family protein [Leptothrix discophora]|uniref:PI3K/PI4K catalytic domain-containing protein n=1 Tax=Leptothrix discophora TaxID=89 RepID=A0ABT9G1P2_LEPDI|nr:hypothetical protein [Leptothrix discophora]MDP4300368.1 hypothetical protein [Leptothrix discophora]
MSQYSFLPEPIQLVVPNSVKSADSPGIGVAYSGQRYVLKVGSPIHPLLPASEWLCCGLAKALSLAVPHVEVCMMPTGELAFGSRMEGGIVAYDFLPLARPTTSNPSVVSGTYVLDMFTANNDRHAGNWLVTDTGGSHVLRPIDFSRAMFFRYPLPTPPFGQSDNSGQFYTVAKLTGTVQRAEAQATHALLSQLPKSVWRGIVSSVPGHWMPSGLDTELINWWWSPQWRTRLKWMESQL